MLCLDGKILIRKTELYLQTLFLTLVLFASTGCKLYFSYIKKQE